MAISRILHINSHGAFRAAHIWQVAINYILKDEKTMNGLLTGSVNCIKEKAYENMKATKKLFGKTDKRQGYHLIISFEENECDENTAMKVIQEFVNEYLEVIMKQCMQCITIQVIFMVILSGIVSDLQTDINITTKRVIGKETFNPE